PRSAPPPRGAAWPRGAREPGWRAGVDEGGGHPAPAVARQRVDLADAARQHLGEPPQRPRADQVAVVVVDELEAIDVEEQQRQRRAVALSAAGLVDVRRVQVARIVDAGCVVVEGTL